MIGGKELYDIKADPGQKNDIAQQHPGIVGQLRKAHETWWDEISPHLDQYCPISLGNDADNPTRLDAMDVMGDVAWHQTHVVLAQKSTGRWTVDVERAGEYSFSLRRWPKELGLSIDKAVSPGDAASHIYANKNGKCNTISPVRARLKIFDHEVDMPVDTEKTDVTFNINLHQTGVTQLDAWFIDKNGDERGAYYVYVKRLTSKPGSPAVAHDPPRVDA